MDKKQKKTIEEMNLRVVSRIDKTVDKIVSSVSYAVVAKYGSDCSMWSYLAYKGPLFLIQTKLKTKKLILLNQCSTKQFILAITDNHHFQLKEFGNNDYMLNYAVDDSFSGLIIKGIWTQDPAIKQIYKILIEDEKNNKLSN